VILLMHGREHGRTFEGRLREIVPEHVNVDAALDELLEVGLLDVSWALDERGAPAEGILALRYDAEVPERPVAGA
jgi:hypothetical protein